MGQHAAKSLGRHDGIRTRSATTRDVDVVAELITALLTELSEGDVCDAEVVRATTRAALDLPGCAIFVAGRGHDCSDGVLTLEPGFAIYAGGKIGTIRELYTKPGVRSTGLGAALIDAAMRHAAEQGWRRVEVTLPEGPAGSPTERFYLREGFKPAGPKLKRIT